MVQFLDQLPPIRSGERGKRALPPELVEFLDVLKQNPGKWAQYPIDRKTKPELPEGYRTARRDGVLYAQFVDGGTAESASSAAGNETNVDADAEDVTFADDESATPYTATGSGV
jgi:hypothetical protein